MKQNKQLSLEFATISGKKVTADFTGGDVTSDIGVTAMREIANKLESLNSSHKQYMMSVTKVM